MADVGSHYLDLFRYLLGDLERIACVSSSAVFGYPVEETATALMEFVSGVHGVLVTTYAVPFSGNVLEIYGTEGTLLVGKELTLVTEGGTESRLAEFPDYYSGLLDRFCRCVTEGGAPLASGMDGLRNLEAIEGAYLSAREGVVVELPA
jgi:predicted dehydrogenase